MSLSKTILGLSMVLALVTQGLYDMISICKVV